MSTSLLLLHLQETFRSKEVCSNCLLLQEVALLSKFDSSGTMTSDPLGAFCDSGLSEFLQGSWENAKTILKLTGISRHPTDEQKYLVISLSQPIVHTIHLK